jgi:hypothetical protein
MTGVTFGAEPATVESLIISALMSAAGRTADEQETIQASQGARLSYRLVLVFRCRIYCGRVFGMATANLKVFLAIRELQEQSNAQQEYIAAIDKVFRELYIENSILGWAARRIFGLYVKNHWPPNTAGIRAIDIPPVIPGTLEIVSDDGEDSEERSEQWPTVSARNGVSRKSVPRLNGRKSVDEDTRHPSHKLTK